MRWVCLAASLLLAACPACGPRGPDKPMFGRPVAQTGLTAEQCKPSCDCCEQPWSAPEWTQMRLAALAAWTLDTPFAEVTVDPYASPVPGRPDGVCAVVVTDLANRHYALQDFASVDAAADAGAYLTHHGACGVCSTLVDLRVYAADPDLGAPVKQCGLDTLNQGWAADEQCLEKLGFTRPCAQIWAWNTQHTRDKCLQTCLLNNGANYNTDDGSLNDCLACDEKESGPHFKAVAGRTRRNTGIASAICRPCEESAPVPHDYP